VQLEQENGQIDRIFILSLEDKWKETIYNQMTYPSVRPIPQKILPLNDWLGLELGELSTHDVSMQSVILVYSTMELITFISEEILRQW